MGQIPRSIERISSSIKFHNKPYSKAMDMTVEQGEQGYYSRPRKQDNKTKVVIKTSTSKYTKTIYTTDLHASMQFHTNKQSSRKNVQIDAESTEFT